MIDYIAEPRNARAVCQAMAWLKAVGIQADLDTTGASDLVLMKKDGGVLPIKLATSSDEPKPAQECLVVLAKELASRDAPIALRAFHAITEAAGFGAPIPVDRGLAPEKNLCYNDNFELVSFRHKEFRRVPNPDPEELLQYEKIMRQASFRFLNMNQQRCRMNSLFVDDLMTYARVWTCNYLGLYKVAKVSNNDNVKKLRAYLKQRFAEFATMIEKKERSCIPSPEAVNIAFEGTPVTPRYGEIAGSFSVEDEVDQDYIERHSELDTTDEDTRRTSAAAVLAKHLQALPHDKMIETLLEASENLALCVVARGEAKRQLRLHKKKCQQCGAAAPVVAVAVEAPAPVPTPDPVVVVPLTGLEQTILTARTAFLAANPATTVCRACAKVFPIQVRLMNGPKLKLGTNTTPNFQPQSRCTSCRSKKTSGA